MSRAELKQRAKDQLGNNIFGSTWMYAVLVVLIEALLSYAVNAIPGVGSIASIVISGPIAYGVVYLFLKQSRDLKSMELSNLFVGFSEDFGGLFLLNLMTNIFIILWSLLFVVPGIIKAYAYSMAMYIKVDHPEYNWSQCLKESQTMMQGHKMELFVLELSFIGWAIVGSLCLGVGTLWVLAYENATRAQFYESIRQEPRIEG